ncbi:Hypothetical protein CINCED_3A021705 [Cinara cedri]|uniref:FHA domain-containing protein n=1 Tax=Cinara cedri TaxID=506608 RepID=A0A5E4N465_9HEMI|nr:Hypothetical protein CINCED_3A021705 [Cinara cedri]
MNSRENNVLTIFTLKNDQTGEHYDMLRKKTHLVARTGFKGDIEISGDTSVSRCHAEMSLVKEVVCGKVKLLLKLIDKNSMFGTFINDGINLNERITPNCPIILKLGDRIRFGVYVSTWTVVKYHFVACPSTLKMVDKEILKKSLKEVGGQVSRDWSEDCTHLCMSSVTVTEKVLLCLASAKSIVLPKYFNDLSKALMLDSLEELPYCIDYKPILTEKLLNPNVVSMDVNNNRKKLFSGKTFICSSTEQMSRISKIVKTAGGDLKYYMDSIICGEEYKFEMLHSQDYIIMQQCQRNAQSNEKYKPILDKLKIINKRPIPENEIGLSIIYASTIKHCNPSYNYTLVNIQSQPIVTTSQEPVILEPETAEILTVDNSEMFSVNIVPDSLTQGSNKRSIDMVMDSEEIVMSKRQALILNDKGKYDSVIEPTPLCSNILSNNEVKENSEQFISVIESTPTCSNILSNNEVKKNSEPFTSVIESTPSCSNVLSYNEVKENLQPFISVIESIPTCNNILPSHGVNFKSSNGDSCLTTVQSSQDILDKKDFSGRVQFLQPITVDKNVNSTVQHNTTKRKLSSFCLISENEDGDEDEDPFDYMDIDETEENTIKKPKREQMESVFPPVLSAMTNKSENSKSVEKNYNLSVNPNSNIAVDPNYIMNLLATAKGTGQFIDTSKHSNNSFVSVCENSKNNDLINSVITETVNMVVSRPIKQVKSMVEGIPHLNNFKKFRRKGPIIRIPNIIPLELSQD